MLQVLCKMFRITSVWLVDLINVVEREIHTLPTSSSFFFCWRYNPLWVLAFSVIFFHSVLSLLSFLHPFIPIIWISSSTSSIHLSLGLTLILLPIGFNSNILLGILPPSIRITCPSQAILLLFINVTMSALPAKNTLSLCNFFRCFPNTVTFSYMCS